MAIDSSTRIDSVHLTVRDLDRSLRFYEERVGFVRLDRDDLVATMGVSGTPLLVLHESRDAPTPRRKTTGLYHFAILVPSRGDLSTAFQHLIETRTPMQGYSDHAVSEALYLADPDSNGIEIYRDRPRDQWPFVNGELQMDSRPLDLQNLIADPDGASVWAGMAAGTRIGHIHLHVAHLDQAERFYRDALGFDLTQRYAGTASFLSAGGYHHHVAVNTWAGEGAPPPPPGAIGLHHAVIRVPTSEALAAVGQSLSSSSISFTGNDHQIEVSDPSGNRIVIQTVREYASTRVR
jgi:catechol 2,3-dioxygenase